LDARVDGTVDAASTIDGRVVVDEGAEIVNSTIRGPAAIGRGTRVVDSFIGPFSAVGAGCEIVGSEIEHSVVMEGSKVLHIPRLADSLIGQEAVVSRSNRRPRSLRLMVGDHCQIDVE
jgi:glucose-1-phosphate thymidylyltransferase